MVSPVSASVSVEAEEEEALVVWLLMSLLVMVHLEVVVVKEVVVKPMIVAALMFNPVTCSAELLVTVERQDLGQVETVVTLVSY
jgi:hypothetical protein